MARTNLEIVSAVNNNLQNYLTQVYKIPILTDEEEMRYARLKSTGDMNAAKMLINSHLRLVVKIANKYKNYGFPALDLISEGNIGLMKAVKEFDISKNCKLATYAMWWIRASIQDYILKNWSLVKICTTIAQKKLFFNLGKIKNKIMSYNQRYLSNDNVKYITDTLGVTDDDVITMDSRMSHKDVFLNKKSNDDDDGREIIELIKDRRGSPEEIASIKSDKELRNRIFHEAMRTLNEREKDIISKRNFGDEQSTLKDLSSQYGVSSERVRQIEESAIMKMKNYVRINYKNYGS